MPHRPSLSRASALRPLAALLALAVLGLPVLGLAGCASDQPPVIDRLAGTRVRGDADHVSVLGSRLDALPLAVIHCARYGRSAQFAHPDGDRSVFDCRVKPQ